MAGIYIHIPFCKQACYYCDFHFSTNQQLQSALIKAISSELELQKNYLGAEPIKTIYFGGGTPSLIPAHELGGVLEKIHSTFQVNPLAEITLEANPDDLTPATLHAFSGIGINRLSIGIQSFHSEQLKFLNRAHDSNSAIQSFNDARKAGFKNISIDLIYAIPDETDDQWLADIRKAVALQPEHLSCYALTIEEKTVFGRWSAAGKLTPTVDEVAARQLEMLMDELSMAGYEHYEISNFARPGWYSKHNSSYWKQEKYLGVGPSAHSFNGDTRQFNIANNHLYVKSVQASNLAYEKEALTREHKINEYILTTLRTRWGTNLQLLKQLYEYDLFHENDEYLSQLLKNDFIILENDVLLLTRKGKLLADKISSDLFVPSL